MTFIGTKVYEYTLILIYFQMYKNQLISERLLF